MDQATLHAFSMATLTGIVLVPLLYFARTMTLLRTKGGPGLVIRPEYADSMNDATRRLIEAMDAVLKRLVIADGVLLVARFVIFAITRH